MDIFYSQWLFQNADPSEIEKKMGDMIDDKSVPLSPDDAGDGEVGTTIEMEEPKKEMKRPSFLSAPFAKIARRHSSDARMKETPMAQLDMFSNSAPPQSPDSLQEPLNEISPSKSTKDMIDTVFDQVRCRHHFTSLMLKTKKFFT